MSRDYITDSFYGTNHFPPEDLGELLAKSSDRDIAVILEEAGRVRNQRFGKRINLYAPLYLSNYCSNHCLYCGFNSSRDIPRTVLTPEETQKEVEYLASAGFKSVLLVGGEDPFRAGHSYYRDAISPLLKTFSSVSLELSPFSISEYQKLYSAGADGVTVYQETYNENLYADYHISGSKKDYRWRLETPERAALAGIPNVNIGALLGLAPWKEEILALASHLNYLIKKYWKVNFGISFPRILSKSEDFKVPYPVSDRDFVKILASMRLCFPDTPIYLSTRESPVMRDNLLKYGVTHMSAESQTAPGGYLNPGSVCEQFGVTDTRKVVDIMETIKSAGLSPVFKDWDKGYIPSEKNLCG